MPGRSRNAGRARLATTESSTIVRTVRLNDRIKLLPVQVFLLSFSLDKVTASDQIVLLSGIFIRINCKRALPKLKEYLVEHEKGRPNILATNVPGPFMALFVSPIPEVLALDFI